MHSTNSHSSSNTEYFSSENDGMLTRIDLGIVSFDRDLKFTSHVNQKANRVAIGNY